MDKKMLIVLYGEHNRGKTTTLLELVILLAGGSKSVRDSVYDAASKNRDNDARFIVKYSVDSKDYYIYVGTGGDTWYICSVNTHLFENKLGMNVWLVENKEAKRMKSHDKKRFKKESPSICITSCRPDGDDYGAIKAIHNYVERHNADYEKMLWLRKDGQDNITEDEALRLAKKKAEELKNIINVYLSQL